MLHLVPRWQSSDRHVKLKTIMQVSAFLIRNSWFYAQPRAAVLKQRVLTITEKRNMSHHTTERTTREPLDLSDEDEVS
jgi:hypothetical protein